MESTDKIIFYHTQHNENTKKLVECSQELGFKIVQTPSDINDLSYYKYIGFASGIYFWDVGKTLYQQFDKIENLKDKKCFIAYTCGEPKDSYLSTVITKIKEKGGEYCGEYHCLGHTNYFPLNLFGGLKKGHPSDEEKEAFKEFLKGIISK